MLALSGDARVFMHTDSIDLRKGFEGLSYMTESLFPKMLLTGAYFVFLNKTRNRMKVLYWDVDGLAIWHSGCQSRTSTLKFHFGIKSLGCHHLNFFP